MNDRQYSYLRQLICVLGAVLCLLLAVKPVLADDSPIEAPAVTEEAVPVTDTEPAASAEDGGAEETGDNMPTEEGVLAEGAEPEEIPTPDTEEPAPATDETSEPAGEEEIVIELAALAEVIAAADEGELVLADAGGEALALTDAESAETLLDGDPYFMVGTTKYSFTTTDCNPDAAGNQPCINPLQAAVDYIRVNGTIPTDRMIYVEDGSYIGATIDGALYPALSQLKGLIGNGSGATTLSSSLMVWAPAMGFTVKGFTINGLLSIQDAAGNILLEDLVVKNTAGIGISVLTSGSIDLKGVNSSQNKGQGAILDNQGSPTYKVNITNSAFDGNNNLIDNIGGLEVYSDGVITLDGVSASRNRGDGADMYAGFKSLTVKNSYFGENFMDPDFGWGYGLWAWNESPCTVTLENVITGGNEFTNIFLHVDGNIKATNVETRWSTTGSGFVVDSSFSTSTRMVQITNGVFSDNNQDGLWIENLGSVTLKNIIANNNTNGRGAYIDNCLDSGGGVCLGMGNVTLSGVLTAGKINEFSENGESGLEISSRGTVTLSNLDATKNGSNGVMVTNNYSGTTGGMTVNSTMSGSWLNWFGENGDNGLAVASNGNILVTDSAGQSNTECGFKLDNTSGSGKSIQVKLSEANGNGYEGLQAGASGSITLLNNTSFLENGFGGNRNGVHLITIKGNVSVSGKSTEEVTEFGINDENGLAIEANGNVSIKNVRANGNYGPNGILVAATATSGKTVSITNAQFSENNYGNGLLVHASGAITLDTVQGNYNNQYGAYLDNCQEDIMGDCTGSGNVTVKAKSGQTNWFTENNNNTGLYILSKGTISLTNVSADYNYNGFGAFLYNGFANASGGITVKATNDQFNSFSLSQVDGLHAESNGTISVARINANYNQVYGVYLNNLGAATPKTITISDLYCNYNHYEGLAANASGAIKVSGAQAYQNSMQTGTLAFAGETLYEFLHENIPDSDGNMYFQHDYWFFNAPGPVMTTITLSSDDFIPNFTVWNSTYGYVVTENNPGNNSSITRTFMLPGSGDYTINVYTNDGRGNYVLALNDPSNSNPWEPEVNGLALYSISGGVTISNSKMMGFGADAYDNGHDGVHIEAAGTVKTSNVFSNHNGRRGLSVDNTFAASSGVTISNSYLDDNYMVGAIVNTNGAVKWTNGSANYNHHEGGAGFILGNAAPVTLSNVEINFNNNLSGLFIWTGGNVSLTNVDASYTGDAIGADIRNNSGTGSVTIKASGKGQVCSFNSNGSIGLSILSNGNVSLSGVEATWNSSNGTWMDLTGSSGTPTVKISNSIFNNNEYIGLNVNTKGAVTLTNVDASGNSLQGGWLDISSHGQTQNEHLGYYNESDAWWFHFSIGSPVLIEVDSADFSPEFEIYSEYGYNYGSASAGGTSHAQYSFNPGWESDFYVVVWGGNGYYDISLNDTPNTYSSSVPYITGAFIDNCVWSGSGCSGTGGVTIGGNTENEFSGNNGNGLYISSYGAVSITNASASTNGDDGIFVNNTYGTGTVHVKNTIKGGRSYFNENKSNGLEINASGTVTLNKIGVVSNPGTGVYVSNWDNVLKNGLTVSDVYIASNGGHGLSSYGSGVVNITNVSSYGNSSRGIYIVNSDAATPQSVTIKKTTTNYNVGSHGIDVHSKGAISLYAVEASGNGNHGVNLDNDYNDAVGGITISGALGSSYIESNGSSGLVAQSRGAISVSRVFANWNDVYGVHLTNPLGSGNLTISAVSAAYNGAGGIFGEVNGAISVSGVSCLRNGETYNDDGILLITGAYPVTIKNSTFIGNWGSGIEIQFDGPYWPTISNTSYMGNDVNHTGDLNLLLIDL